MHCDKSLFLLNEGNYTKLAQAEALRNARSTEQPGQIVHPVYAQIIPNEKLIEEPKPVTKCETPGCLSAAMRIMSYMDENIDPCENFYEFSCGNYLKNTQIPEDKVTVDSFSNVRDLVQEQLRTIINEPPQPNESKPFRLAKYFNSACLNKTIIEERGIKPLSDILEAYGGWPVVKGDLWSEGGFDWVEVIKKFRRMGLDTYIVFAFSVVTDLKNSTGRVLDVSILKRVFTR